MRNKKAEDSELSKTVKDIIEKLRPLRCNHVNSLLEKQRTAEEWSRTAG